MDMTDHRLPKILAPSSSGGASAAGLETLWPHDTENQPGLNPLGRFKRVQEFFDGLTLYKETLCSSLSLDVGTSNICLLSVP